MVELSVLMAGVNGGYVISFERWRCFFRDVFIRELLS